MTYLHLFSWNPLGNPGGMETVICTTAKAQAAIGHKVFVVGRSYGKKSGVIKTVVDNVTYIQVQNLFKRRPSTLQIGIGGYTLLIAEILFTLLVLTPVVTTLVIRKKVDLVLFYGIHLFGMSPFIRLFGTKTAVVFEALQRNPYVSPWQWLYWFRQIKYACFNAIFTVVNKYYYVDGSFIDNVKLLKQYARFTKIYCFPWGIEFEDMLKIKPDPRYEKVKKNNKIKIVVCPRRLVEEKGVRYLVEAIPAILKKIPESLFIFTSDGILKNELKKRTKKLGIQRNIIFTGNLPYRKVLQIIKSSDLMVGPSSGEELFGMVFLEAYALKVPIVATKFGGIPNVVHDKKTGILVSPRNVDELAKKIIYVLSHKSELKKMIDAGFKLVKKEYKLSKTVKYMDTVMQKL